VTHFVVEADAFVIMRLEQYQHSNVSTRKFKNQVLPRFSPYIVFPLDGGCHAADHIRLLVLLSVRRWQNDYLATVMSV
jgi:hypothetical protein